MRFVFLRMWKASWPRFEVPAGMLDWRGEALSKFSISLPANPIGFMPLPAVGEIKLKVLLKGAYKSSYCYYAKK